MVGWKVVGMLLEGCWNFVGRLLVGLWFVGSLVVGCFKVGFWLGVRCWLIVGRLLVGCW